MVPLRANLIGTGDYTVVGLNCSGGGRGVSWAEQVLEPRGVMHKANIGMDAAVASDGGKVCIGKLAMLVSLMQ